MKLYKRVSLDDDLEEEMRAELLSVLVSGASNAIQTLHLVIICLNRTRVNMFESVALHGKMMLVTNYLA